MTDAQLCDYYEILEVSQNANSYTIERVFRFLAKRFHPDVAESGDVHRFTKIVEAYETLKDPKLRAAYDVELQAMQQETSELVSEASTVDEDTKDRHRLLTLFYAKRKRDMKNPGVGVATLEQAFDMPETTLNFNLWYFREKNWIKREDSGLLSITAEGVDKIEERALLNAQSQAQAEKITDGALRLPDMTGSASANATPAMT
jgi:curved DNA-binding protein CbpA